MPLFAATKLVSMLPVKVKMNGADDAFGANAAVSAATEVPSSSSSFIVKLLIAERKDHMQDSCQIGRIERSPSNQVFSVIFYL
jgi:hypothetical protein